MKNNEIIIGSKIILCIEIDPIGDYHMSDYDFECDLFTCNKHIIVKKEQMVKDTNDRYYIPLDTKNLSKGHLLNRVHTHIPDVRFENGIRDEITEIDTNLILIK